MKLWNMKLWNYFSVMKVWNCKVSINLYIAEKRFGKLLLEYPKGIGENSFDVTINLLE